MRLLFYGVALVCLALPSQIAAPEPSGWALTIAWSPDGETIAVGSSDGLWFFDDAFNVVGFAATPQFEGFPPTTMDWSADGGLIALAINWIPFYHQDGQFYTGDFPILIVDADSREVIKAIEFPRPSSGIRWHPQERLILVGALGGPAHILNAATGDSEYVFDKETTGGKRVTAEAVCWVSDSVAALFAANATYVVDIANDELLHLIDRRGNGYDGQAADCNGNGGAINDIGNHHDLATGQISRAYTMDNNFTMGDYWRHVLAIAGIAYSPDGAKIATNGNSSLCRTAVFDGRNHQLIAELQGSYARFGRHYFRDSIAWHPSSEKLAIVGQFDIRIWDAETYELLQRFDGFNAGYYNPHPKARQAGEPETPRQREMRELRCPDFPASMLFKK